MNQDDLEQAAYLRGWNDRPKGDMWFGVIIGVTVGLALALIITMVA